MKPDGSKYICRQVFTDFQDKGKLTVIVADKLYINKETKEVHCKVTQFCVVRDFGGFGYKGTIKPLV